jgi:putative N6-adenine-specific DNA methylase
LSSQLSLVATCGRGLEELLATELESAGIAPTAREVAGVRFRGDFEVALRANWRSRIANRILIELASWDAGDDATLYAGARALFASGGRLEIEGATPAPLLHPSRTFALRATSSRSALRDTRWIALRVKDGLVDGQRDRFGRRSNVARDAPDLALRLRLHGDRATLLLDTSGEPLDRRGYRVASTGAPVREQLAAAAVLASGWDGRGPVVDPMCGTGTLLAEAGAIALGLPPHRLRTRWAFERLPGFDRERLARIRAEPFPAPGPDVRLHGVDLDAEALAAAERNLAAAGLAERSVLRVGDGLELEPPAGPGLVTINPPYGQRLEWSAADWRRLGDRLKRAYAGWRAVLLAGGEGFGKELGLRPRRRIPVWNGPLEARILVLDVY